MKIPIAADRFKGTHTARQVADAIAAGVERTGAEAISLPMADGGEVTLSALTEPLALAQLTVAASSCSRPIDDRATVDSHRGR